MTRAITIRIFRWIAMAVVLTTYSIATNAEPRIPPSELPGRERDRFQTSPVDRFTQQPPAQKETPPWPRECRPEKIKSRKHRAADSKHC